MHVASTFVFIKKAILKTKKHYVSVRLLKAPNKSRELFRISDQLLKAPSLTLPLIPSQNLRDKMFCFFSDKITKIRQTMCKSVPLNDGATDYNMDSTVSPLFISSADGARGYQCNLAGFLPGSLVKAWPSQQFR